MTDQVWINNRQPQTLYMAQVLLYISAVSALVFGAGEAVIESVLARYIVAALLTFGAAGAAYGIANHRRWGYQLGIAAAMAPFIVRIELGRRVDFGAMLEWNPIGLLFDIAIVAALLHPMSRGYQKSYFR